MKKEFYEELQQSDWLGRNPNDYTYKKSGLSIGWEDTLTKGDALSKFILKVQAKNLTPERKVMLTKQACGNILSRMNALKKKAKIVFTDQFSSYQMDTTICVTLEPLSGKIPFPSFNHSLDPILGFCVHEIAHFLYTDKEYNDYLQKFKGSEAKLKRMIMNVLEDERIEQIVSGTFRGYTGYLGKAKDYCFGKRFIEEKAKRNIDDQQEIVQLAETFLHLLRYPKALEETYVNKFETELREIMGILTPYPENIVEMTVCTDKIYEVFQKNQDDQESGDGDGDGEEGESDDQQDGKGKGKKSKSGSGNSQNSDNSENSDEEDSDDEDGSSDDQEGKDDDADKGKGSDGSGGDEEENDDANDGDGEDEDDDKKDGKGKNGSDPQDDADDKEDGDDQDGGSGKADIDKLLEAFAEAVMSAEPITGGDADAVAELIGQKGRYAVSEAINEISNYDNDQILPTQSFAHNYPETENLRTSELRVYFNEAKNLNSTTNHYDSALSEVKSYSASLRAKIQQLNRSQDITYKGLTEGDFDDGMLVDAIIGSKTIYKQDHRVMNRGACVALLIDESGSMHHASRWYQAMKIAVMFERALEGVNNVDFYCYGHTTGKDTRTSNSDATWINVYYEGRKKSDRKALGKIHNHATNRDGHAILEVVGRMRTKVPANMPIILFMISDGEPSASVPDGYSGVTYTKKAVNVVEKYSNTQVIHIAIDTGIPSAEMFNQFVEFTDHRKLVTDLGNLLKKVITKQQMPVTL
jgi:cobalamin biosynthesis protein CobT